MSHRLYTVVAELTYRCPLQCLYCSNPIEFAAARGELTTAQWAAVFRDAAALGALQLHLSGGEPTLRPDLEELIEAARGADLYVNLITAGTLLDRDKLDRWRDSGLDHIQLSVQDSDRETAEIIAGVRSFDKKLSSAKLIREAGFPLTLNIVLHRLNIGRIPQMVDLAIGLGADRLELANTQYYAWALKNRGALIPTRAQNDNAEEFVRAARERHRDELEIAFVRADYFSDRPKPCMGGWANNYLCITPIGDVLPCHAASVIPGLRFENVRERGLADILQNSSALNAFRGDDWMIEPCRSCPNKNADFGGCRCQAFLLTGNASGTDPVCSFSPEHHKVIEVAGNDSPKPELTYRNVANSRRLSVQD